MILMLGIAAGIAIGWAIDAAGSVRNDAKAATHQSSQRLGPRATSDGHSIDELGFHSGEELHMGRSPEAAIRNAAEILILRLINRDAINLSNYQAYGLICWMNPEEIQRALIELGELEANIGVQLTLQSMLAELWVKADGEGALMAVMGSEQLKNRPNLVSDMLDEWGKQNPQQCHEWLADHQADFNAYDLKSARISRISGIAMQDMDAAFRELEHSDGDCRYYAMSAITRKVVCNAAEREEIINRIEQMEDGVFKQEIWGAFMSTWVSSNPKDFVAYIRTLDADAEYYPDMQLNMVNLLKYSDPEAATHWQLDHLQEGVPAGDQIADNFAYWVADNPQSAWSWLERQPEEVRTDNLYMQVVSSLKHDGPTEIIAQIKDPVKRINALQMTRATMERIGGKALSVWLEKLPGSLRDELNQAQNGLE